MAARPVKPRASLQEAFVNPPLKSSNKTTPSLFRAQVPKAQVKATDPQRAQKVASPRTRKPADISGSPSNPQSLNSQNSPVPKSSAALRETIAKAKAAKRSASGTKFGNVKGSTSNVDAFPNIEIGGNSDEVLRQRVATARVDGRLNIAAMELTEMPPEVLNMYSADPGSGAWYESVDLVRLIAADNKFESLDNSNFPDGSARSHDEDDYQESIFQGLETLDIHGNLLRNLPNGLRNLDRLTNLNVSKNSLTVGSLQVIGQIQSLRELRLAGNAIDGELTSELYDLKSLEILDISANNISEVSCQISQLSNLRILNVANNKLTTLPWESLATLPLIELVAARNRLSGTLLPSDTHFERLKTLDVACNAILSLSEMNLNLPSLQFLDITENRLSTLPDVSSCSELLTLTVGGNKLSAWPQGMTSLKQLKNIDVTRNDIKMIEQDIGFMDSLTVLRVANNPLGERKFLSMDTDELKRELRARSLAKDSATSQDDETFGPIHPNPDSRVKASYPGSIKPGGILDCSSSNVKTSEDLHLESVAKDAEIKTLILHHNLFTSIPETLESIGNTLMSLDLSNNRLVDGGVLTDISLPNLKTLDISANAITSLSLFMEHLDAPKLAEWHVSRNRLNSLPQLRLAFPSLTVLSAANNRLSRLGYEEVKGLQVLDVSGNEIHHLEPRLGLLGAEGLRSLMIGGNTFRVPRRDILDKGTQAVLTWLRGRIPEDQIP